MKTKTGLNYMFQDAYNNDQDPKKVIEQLISIASLNNKNAVKSIKEDTPLPIIGMKGIEMAETTDEKLDSLSSDGIRLEKYYQEAKIFCESVNWKWEDILAHNFIFKEN